MVKSNRFCYPVGIALLVGIPLLACSSSSNPISNAQSAVCCTEFQAGATVNANIGGSAQSQVAVQAIADISGIAAGAVADVTAACRGIASDLGAAQTDMDTAENTPDDDDKMGAWCKLAVAQIGTVKGSAQLTINVVPAQCSASLSAQADCQAKCDVSGKCDIKANPPTCMGGTLSVDCKGGCTAMAGATLSCTGSCTGNCSGSCTAMGGVAVDCTGKCDGTCAAGGMAGGSGIQADGSCKGTCMGTCTASATAPSVKCSGSCSGKCDATCQGSATASVKCDGKCDADYTPLSCQGGTLSGGCMVDAKCGGNCNASVQAKASCTPPQITVAFGASADTNLGKLKATLEANLPKIIEVKTRFTLLGDAAATVSGNFSAVTDIKAACIPAVVAAAAQSAKDVTATVQASGSIATSLGM
jgi:hypothetical protein